MAAPELVTSLQNPLVKRLVRLRQRREREAEGVLLVEGAREITRAVGAGFTVLTLVTCPARYSPEAVTAAAALRARVQPTEFSRDAFDKVSGRENPDGLIAVFREPEHHVPEPSGDALVVVLHGLEKPGNVGAIVRTADAAGVHAVLVLGRGADPYSPNVIRSSQGSVFTVPVVPMDEGEALGWLTAHGFRTVACTPDASRLYWEADLTGRAALLLGTEHQGLPPEWRTTDDAVRIPMNAHGGADSLNVATAAALVLFESVRQRRQEI